MFFQIVTLKQITCSILLSRCRHTALSPPSLTGHHQSEPANVGDVGWVGSHQPDSQRRSGADGQPSWRSSRTATSWIASRRLSPVSSSKPNIHSCLDSLHRLRGRVRVGVLSPFLAPIRRMTLPMPTTTYSQPPFLPRPHLFPYTLIAYHPFSYSLPRLRGRARVGVNF